MEKHLQNFYPCNIINWNDYIIQQTIKQIFIECQDDHIGLWSIIAALENNGITTPNELRQNTMQVIRALLDEKDIVAFNYNKPTYFVWTLSPKEAIARIEKEWNALGRDPSLGDIVWFTSRKMAANL